MSKAPYLIPVENQVRELDAKLLLACFAVQRGHTCYIGYKGALDGYINTFPKGVYFAKSVTKRSVIILQIARMLGHRNVAWDEEAVVHFPPKIYYQRRLSETALQLTDQLLAWGDDNKSLFEHYPNYSGTPVQVVGNPRMDLLRPEIRGFYDDDVRAIRDTHGEFVLFNTNFGSVNGYYPEQNVCYRDDTAPDGLVLGRGSIGFSRDFALELYKYRQNNFETMKALIPEVARAFPDRSFVVRPHPSENMTFWRDYLSDIKNVHVTAEGNVVPWLIGASALIHNSCTTGIESYILDCPAIAYVPTNGAEEYGSNLPNLMSHIATTPREVMEKIETALGDQGLVAQDDERTKLLSGFLASLEGTFSCERIVSAIESETRPGTASALQQARGTVRAISRRLKKRLQTTEDSGRYGLAYKRQRFPELTPDALEAKGRRLCDLAGLKSAIEVEQVRTDIFRVTAR